MTKSKLKTFHFLPITPRLKSMENSIYNDIREFARFRYKKPELEDLSDYPELDAICDAALLIKSGAVKIEFTDDLLGAGEGYIVELKEG